MAKQTPKAPEKEPKKAPGVRARVRAELTAEIKAAATRQLAVDGAAGLSLRAIARELEMASSAIYRYFASREELLTALIIDAYTSLGDAVEAADAAHPREEFAPRFVSMAKALRSWAIDKPNEYALIYGSPIPGYAAPQDTVDSATRIPVALLTVMVEGRVKNSTASRTSSEDDSLAQALDGLMTFTGRTIPPGPLAIAVEAWAELFGLVSLESFGHFENAVTDPEAFFDHAVRTLADRVMG